MWKPPADEAVWTPPADERVAPTLRDKASAMYDKGSEYAQKGLNVAADYSSRAQNAVMGPLVNGVVRGAQGLSNAAFGTEAPANMLGQAVSYLPQKIEQFGQYVAEKGGEKFPNMPAAIPALAGLVAANAPYLAVPGPKIEGSFLKPVIPAERQAAAAAALREGVQLSRAEQTGGRFAAGAENLLEKSPMGSIPMQEARGASDAQMMAYKDRLHNTMGTSREPYDIGAQAQKDRVAREAAMNAKRDEMFNAVPDNVHVPLHNSRNLADTIMQEQADYLPTTRNPDISAIAKDVQNAHAGVSDGTGVYDAPSNTGYTYQTPEQRIPGETQITEHAPEPAANGSYSVSDAGDVHSNENTPSHFTSEQTPDKVIPGKDVYASKYSAHPNAGPATPKRQLNIMMGGEEGDPYALFDYNDPITGKDSYQIHGDAERLGYKTTPNVPIETVNQHGLNVVGKTQKAAQLGHEPLDLPGEAAQPGIEPKSNYQQLKRLREVVGTKAQDARKAGDFAKERDFLRMKSAIDKDVEDYVANQDTPLGSMVGKEFAETYKKANAFSGAYKQLFKGDLSTSVENAAPEKVLDMVFKQNNETAIKQFRAIVGDNAFQSAKKKWVSDLLESPNVERELSDAKITPGTLNAILTPVEKQKLIDYAGVQKLRKTVGGEQGTNGSARTNVQAVSYAGLGGALTALATGNFAAAGGLAASFLAPYPIAKTVVGAANGVHVAVPNSLRNAALAQFVDRVITKKNENGRK